MKLPIVPSFYFFIVCCIGLHSCKNDSTKKQPIAPEILQNEEKANTFYMKKMYDSALHYQNKATQIAKHKNDLLSVQYGYNRSYRYSYRKKNHEQAISYIDSLYEISAILGDSLWMGKAKMKAADILKEGDFLKPAITNYYEAEKIFKQIKDSGNISKAQLNLAYLSKREGNYGSSYVTALEGLEYVQNTKDYKTKAGLYHVLAVALKEKGDLNMAMNRINTALEMTEDSLKLRQIGIANKLKFINSKANIYREMEDYNAALQEYEKALKSTNDTIELKRIQANKAITLYYQKGYHSQPDSLLKDADTYFSKLNLQEELHGVNLKLAELYENKDKNKAIGRVEIALALAREIDNKKSVREALQVKFEIENSENPEALEFFRLNEELEKNEEDVRTLYANERYDLKSMENEKNIQAKNRIIAENERKETRITLLVVTLILLIILIATYVIYQKIQRRHKIEKVKTVQNTEARISAKVHDELANDIHKLMAQLETSDPEKEIILDRLDLIYNNARDISKQTQSINTDTHYAEELNNLLRSYRSDDINVMLKRYDTTIWEEISSHVKLTVYRVLQELLTNMKKHSNAALVVVSIEKVQKQLRIQYIDNGKGFSEKISKNGLQNAENRIHAISGTLTFDTELHKGCKFSINVPI